MRIIAGEAKGRTLKTPKGMKIRPTSDRVRGSVFNVLGQWFEGERVLDLFSGTGALGLEALSRGAGEAVLVDSGKEGAALSAENARALGFGDRVQVLRQTAEDAVAQFGSQGLQFDLVFLDPPYAQQAVFGIVAALVEAKVLAAGARVVAEHGKDEDPPEQVATLARQFHRRFGDTAVSIYG